MNAAQHAAMLESGRVRINVTQKDIENGIAGAKARCPIALAACRAFRATTSADRGVEVHPLRGVGYPIRGSFREAVYEYELPMRVSNWIGIFDNEEPVKPIRFTTLCRRMTNFGKRYCKEPQ